MAFKSSEFDTSRAKDNLEALAANPYPGRGIILGRSENPDELIEAYWVMGRSENSRNRLLVQDGDVIKTTAFDWGKVEDPSLIIYNAMRVQGDSYDHPVLHIVSNGDQTDSVHDLVTECRTRLKVDSFRDALLRREFEPDDPNFTPRITGAIAMGLSWNDYNYSIIRRNPITGMAEHAFGGGRLTDIPAGAGLCFHTYQGDDEPLPAFEGSPYVIPLGSSADGIAEDLWEALDKENRVGLAVRTIDALYGDIRDTQIINQLNK